ncbi:MAG: hypothetical protein EOO68_03420 [Moraxellaceae bacterium]|nr:MAG: hypothetical protein EOO68_03420 [Moraxellaceae bacterium]
MFPDLTDEKGNFKYGGISGGLFGCPDVKLKFIKPGYDTLIKTFPSGTHQDTVLLKKLKN